jgi:DNA repair protein RAD5
MGEMEPAHSFNLTLRGYQKQALLFVPLLYLKSIVDTFINRWMHSLENGTMDARDATSMDPLWNQ